MRAFNIEYPSGKFGRHKGFFINGFCIIPMKGKIEVGTQIRGVPLFKLAALYKCEGDYTIFERQHKIDEHEDQKYHKAIAKSFGG